MERHARLLYHGKEQSESGGRLVVCLKKNAEEACFSVLSGGSRFNIRARGDRQNESCSFGVSLMTRIACVNSRPIHPLNKATKTSDKLRLTLPATRKHASSLGGLRGASLQLVDTDVGRDQMGLVTRVTPSTASQRCALKIQPEDVDRNNNFKRPRRSQPTKCTRHDQVPEPGYV